MTSGGNNYNYFPLNHLTNFSASSLNNKGKQGQWNKFKSEVKKFELLYAELSH